MKPHSNINYNKYIVNDDYEEERNAILNQAKWRPFQNIRKKDQKACSIIHQSIDHSNLEKI